MGMEIPLLAIRQQICSAIDIVIQMQRMPDKSRKVIEVVELDGIQEGEIQLHPLYQLRGNELEKVGELRNIKM